MEPYQAEQIKEVFENALKTLDRCGWCQYTFMNYKNEVCLVGAIHEGSVLSNLPIMSARMYLYTLLGESISAWNDDPQRTEEDVRLLLKRAIYSLETK